MKPGETYTELDLANGAHIVLRALKGSDAPEARRFANGLVAERKVNRDLGLLLDRRLGLQEERKWVRGVVSGVRKGEVVSVAAFEGARMVGHCDVARRKSGDVRHTGTLGIAIMDGYRGMGLGESLMRTALELSGKIGVTLVELEVFANNPKAIRLYRRMGFALVGRVPRKFRRLGRSVDELKMYVDLERRGRA